MAARCWGRGEGGGGGGVVWRSMRSGFQPESGLQTKQISVVTELFFLFCEKSRFLPAESSDYSKKGRARKKGSGPFPCVDCLWRWWEAGGGKIPFVPPFALPFLLFCCQIVGIFFSFSFFLRESERSGI